MCLVLLLLLLLVVVLLRGICLCTLLSNSMYACTRIDTVIDSPIRPFPAIGQWSWDLFETGIQGQIVANRVLSVHNILLALEQHKKLGLTTAVVLQLSNLVT